jgi:hypothetical protein
LSRIRDRKRADKNARLLKRAEVDARRREHKLRHGGRGGGGDGGFNGGSYIGPGS